MGGLSTAPRRATGGREPRVPRATPDRREPGDRRRRSDGRSVEGRDWRRAAADPDAALHESRGRAEVVSADNSVPPVHLAPFVVAALVVRPPATQGQTP